MPLRYPMYDAVLFDLFTALLDSQPLWREVAGSAAVGARWREECSRLAYSAGPYRPFVETVAQAAQLAGVPPTRAADLLRGMGEQLAPWPEAPEVLARLRESVRIGVVTNCSEELGQRAAARVGVHFDTVVTAEAAGAYKPRPEPYRLALDRLGVQPSRARQTHPRIRARLSLNPTSAGSRPCRSGPALPQQYECAGRSIQEDWDQVIRALQRRQAPGLIDDF